MIREIHTENRNQDTLQAKDSIFILTHTMHIMARIHQMFSLQILS